MSSAPSITLQPSGNVFVAGEGEQQAPIVFRSVSQTTDAELAALLRTEDKPSLSATLPRIPTPRPEADPHDFYDVPPSMGATVLSLIAMVAADARRASADQRAAEMQIVIDEIRAQASEMREKGKEQMMYALISASITVAVGVGTAIASGVMAPRVAANRSEQLAAAQLNTLNARLGTANTIAGGLSTAVQGVGSRNAALHDEQVKLHEAEQERTRAMIEHLRSSEESLLDLVRKAIAAMDSIQQTTNQARTRILG